MTTETETETLQWDMVVHQRKNHSRDGGMTLADQNQPEVTWRRSAEKELKSMHLTWSKLRKVARDRSRERDVGGLLRPMMMVIIFYTLLLKRNSEVKKCQVILNRIASPILRPNFGIVYFKRYTFILCKKKFSLHRHFNKHCMKMRTRLPKVGI